MPPPRPMHPAIARLLGRRPNPTEDWPSPGRQSLVYDLRSRSLNGLALNGSFEEAKRFGRSDEADQYGEYLNLFYRQSGLSLEFADHELMTVVFVIGQGSPLAWRRQMSVSSPTFIAADGTRHVFSESSTVQELTSCFGPPVETGPVRNGTMTMRTFVSRGNWVNSVHDENGTLVELEVIEADEGAELEARTRPPIERVAKPEPKAAPRGIFNKHSTFWIWWRGRVNLDPELATPNLNRRLMDVVSREVAECSRSHDGRGNEIRFEDLEVRKEWWARSKAIPTGTIRLELDGGNALLRYELTAWPMAPLTFAVGWGFAGYGLVVRDAAWFCVGLFLGPLISAIQISVDVLIVRWFLRRTLKKALSGLRTTG